ncbi:flagellar biosynthetic protein FliO [Xylophilus sp. GW821-FHT01B05]
MTQALLSIVFFVVILAMVPWVLKWLQRRTGMGKGVGASAAEASRIVSALAVGPQQRVLTVEVGPASARTWIVLGVTPQSITTLHTVPAPRAAEAPGHKSFQAQLPEHFDA